MYCQVVCVLDVVCDSCIARLCVFEAVSKGKSILRGKKTTEMHLSLLILSLFFLLKQSVSALH